MNVTKIIQIIILILLAASAAQATTPIVAWHSQVVLGETVKLNSGVAFPLLSVLPPLFPIPSNAFNVSVRNSTGIAIPYERYTASSYSDLLEKLVVLCGPDEDGYLPVDSGMILEYPGLTIETGDGYCAAPLDGSPRKGVDYLLVNHIGFRNPPELFTLEYELPKNPISNQYCFNNPYGARFVSFVLPTSSFVWAATSEVNDSIVNQESFTLEFHKLKNQTICFSYGTKGEYVGYGDRADDFAFTFLGTELTFVSIFLAIFYVMYPRLKSTVYVHVTGTVFWGVAVMTFLWIKPPILLPPFWTSYGQAVLLYAILSMGVYIVGVLLSLWIYQRCPQCRGIYKRQGYTAHQKVHKTENAIADHEPKSPKTKRKR